MFVHFYYLCSSSTFTFSSTRSYPIIVKTTRTSASAHTIRNVRIGLATILERETDTKADNTDLESRFHLNIVDSKNDQGSLVDLMHVPRELVLEYLK